MSRKPQLKKLMTGLAGEYFVAGMMNLRGWVASLTLKNFPGTDIFGKNPETGKSISVQVKTCWDTSFFIGFKRSERDLLEKKVQGPFVFVHIDGTESVSYYVLSKKEFIDLVISTDNIYYNRPRNKPIKTDYPIAVSLKDLAPYKDHWDSLWR
ncbi:MAG: hypothetical protein K6F21_08015 [Bacteroidales bacterium]|nr:hypothetical protein [Bacteroidales bacterium]